MLNYKENMINKAKDKLHLTKHEPCPLILHMLPLCHPKFHSKGIAGYYNCRCRYAEFKYIMKRYIDIYVSL